jgi:6-phosphogluconolactonase
MVWRTLNYRRSLLYSFAILTLLLAMLAGCTASATPAPEVPAAEAPAEPVEEATEAPAEEAAEESEEAAAAEVEATDEATEEAAEEVTAEPTEEATEEAAEEATEEATAEATEEATEEPTEEAMEEATAEATEEPTEEATEEAVEEADEEATPTPTEEAEEEASAAGTGSGQYAYVGTYTRGAPGGWSDVAEASPPEGVYVFAFDPETGDMTLIQTVPSENPSFVAIDHAQDNLYVVNEIADYEGEEAGSIEAYAIDAATGELTLLNRQAIDIIPAHLAVDPTDSFVVIANYSGGSFQLLPIAEDGSLEEVSSTIEQTGSGPNTSRQESPHPHSVVFDPSGSYIATADLGIDMVQIFQIDGDQLVEVSSATVEPGSGPRHVAFDPDGEFLYLINELTSDIYVFPFDASTGELGEAIQTISTVAEDFPPEKSTAEIMVHPSGRFLYASNRKHTDHPDADAIVAYSIDEESGELTLIGHTTEGIAFPRAFNFDPTGTWLYALNQKGDTIVQFEIDQETGELTATGLVIETPVPVSLVFKTE